MTGQSAGVTQVRANSFNLLPLTAMIVIAAAACGSQERVIGGPNAIIRLIIREEDDSNTAIIRLGILGDAPFSKTAMVMTSETAAKDALNNATYAIGYLAYSGVVADDMIVNPVALDGLHPADADADYPLPSRNLGVAFLPEKLNELQGLVDFITGSAARDMLVRQGLLAVS